MSGTNIFGESEEEEEGVPDPLSGDLPDSYFAYPGEGDFSALLPTGTTTVNFEEGVVTKPDGETDSLSGSLQQKDGNYVRSLFLFSDQDISVKVNNADSRRVGAATSVAQMTPLRVNDWRLTQLAIQPRDPYQARVQIVASTHRALALDPQPIANAQYRSVQGFETTDNYRVLKQQNLLSFSDKTLRVRNTGANDADVQFQRSVANDGVGFRDEATPTLAPGDDYVFDTSNFGRAFRVRAKATVAGNQTTLDYEGGGVL